MAQTTIFVRIGNDVSKTLFNNKETARIDATFITLPQKVEIVLEKICTIPTAQPTAKPTTTRPTAKPTTARPTAKPTTAKPTTAKPTRKPTTQPTAKPSKPTVL